ncbi:ArsR/SmtB family transcription factor [Cesiribacter andamanensis]|uniref:Arsenical resistance operon repressor n=1 Tax=Cesiribacter andamanensis AMV16 TaxID=1279009 RepID=M7NR37_9BACT|nr:metalloregulator ArsR/SmtB family transcription factor [Cesiribacter andamanensis]EMR00974.1 Arsenical resistance operon repressor [Cesiribacter andamanensis AMV16]
MRLKNFSLQFGTQLFKALSDEARLRMLHLLYRKGEMCISDLQLTLEFTQTKTSRHITYLRNAGLLGFRKDDLWIFYFVKEEMEDVVRQLLDPMEKDPELKRDLEVYQILNSNRELAVNKLQRRRWMGPN